jgi:beta-galactosidase/beta-glucuronidase
MTSAGIRTRTGQQPRRRWRTASLAAIALMAAGLAPALAGAPVAAAEAAPTFEQPYLDGHSGPEPVESVSLAGTWGFAPIKNSVCAGASPFNPTGPLTCVHSAATGGPTTIQVPGGGWHKQGWTQLSVAEYSRTITVPVIKGPQVTRVAFGAVNHRATLFVDGNKVGTQVTAYTPSVFDVSRYVTPGRSHQLRVLVEGRKALIGSDGRYTVPEGASWSDDVAQGIFRSANLEVFPAVRISDTVVRTSVRDRTLSYDVEVSNATAKDRKVRLSATLGSWNGAKWKYPGIPSTNVTVPANSTRTVTVGPLSWRAGSASYWWPNVPYTAGYRAPWTR